MWSSSQDANSTSFLDSLLSSLGEDLSFHNHGDLGKNSFAEHLEITLMKLLLKDLTALVTSITGALSLEAWAFFLVSSETMDHSLSRLTVGVWRWFWWWKRLMPHLPKNPGWLGQWEKAILLFVHVGSSVVHASSLSSTGRMLSVLAYSSVTMRHVTSQLSCLFQSGDLETIIKYSIPFLLN